MQHGLLAVVNRTGEDFVLCFEAYEIYFRPTRKAAAASSARADSYSDGASINDMQASSIHTCSRKLSVLYVRRSKKNECPVRMEII
jgi:hypothetical protein